ncbi:hypothetical protein AX761_06190 [Rhizobium sp. 58]|nr:hypothetical protein AX761_06190 [Rhizobium sp. 58]
MFKQASVGTAIPANRQSDLHWFIGNEAPRLSVRVGRKSTAIARMFAPTGIDFRFAVGICLPIAMKAVVTGIAYGNQFKQELLFRVSISQMMDLCSAGDAATFALAARPCENQPPLCLPSFTFEVVVVITKP